MHRILLIFLFHGFVKLIYVVIDSLGGFFHEIYFLFFLQKFLLVLAAHHFFLKIGCAVNVEGQKHTELLNHKFEELTTRGLKVLLHLIQQRVVQCQHFTLSDAFHCESPSVESIFGLLLNIGFLALVNL